MKSSAIEDQSFLWGVANSAFQAEGAPAKSDWQKFSHREGAIADGSTADQACDFWTRYPEDFDLAEDLGCTAFRLSIAWDRIEPVEGRFDEEALDHYENILRDLQRRKIQSLVTLHHFVWPSWLAETGGPLHAKFPQLFARYAEKVVRRLGKYCRYWMSFNEANVLVHHGYNEGIWPPQHYRKTGHALQALAAMAEAHVRSVQQLEDKRSEIFWGVAQHIRLFDCGAKANIFDKVFRKLTDWAFNFQYLRSLSGNIFLWFPGAKPIIRRLPTSKDFRSLDFIGVNYYGRMMLKARLKAGFIEVFEGPGEKSDLGWEIYPEGLSQVLRACFEKFRLPLIVTENGLADSQDKWRSKFLCSHVHEALKVRSEGIPVLGYLHWSLTDNFEWSEGLKARFGLVEIDYENGGKRAKRPSFETYRKLIQTHRDEAKIKIKNLAHPSA